MDRRNMVGGVCINTGTIPSKTLRESVLYLTALSQRELYGQAYRVKDGHHRRRSLGAYPACDRPGDRRHP